MKPFKIEAHITLRKGTRCQFCAGNIINMNKTKSENMESFFVDYLSSGNKWYNIKQDESEVSIEVCEQNIFINVIGILKAAIECDNIKIDIINSHYQGKLNSSSIINVMNPENDENLLMLELI